MKSFAPLGSSSKASCFLCIAVAGVGYTLGHTSQTSLYCSGWTPILWLSAMHTLAATY